MNELVGLDVRPANAAGGASFVGRMPLWVPGSPTPSNSSVEMPLFPPLPICKDTSLNSPLACPGPKAIDDAMNSLRSVLGGSCPSCTQFVFTTNLQQFGNNSGSKVQFLNGNQQTYANFVSQPPFFFDGTRSNIRMDYFECGNPPTSGCKFGRQKMSDFMTATSSTAVSQTPSRYRKMITALAGSGPHKVCSVPASSASGGTLNVATLFHEALHGRSGLMDLTLVPQPDLLTLFGLNDLGSTDELTFYLLGNVLGGGLRQCPN